MKLQIEYPNYTSALMFVIGDKRPYSVSDDKSKLAYQIPLANFKRGFDFYELNKAKDGSVFFTIVTMVDFKTICETNSQYHYQDMSVLDWQKEIFDIIFRHFSKEEYLALKRGYIKSRSAKNQNIQTNRPNEIDLKHSSTIKEKDYVDFEPLNDDLKYLKYKPKDEWNKTEKFRQSSDQFLKLSLELSQQKKSGCILVLLPIITLTLIALCL